MKEKPPRLATYRNWRKLKKLLTKKEYEALMKNKPDMTLQEARYYISVASQRRYS